MSLEFYENCFKELFIFNGKTAYRKSDFDVNIKQNLIVIKWVFEEKSLL